MDVTTAVDPRPPLAVARSSPVKTPATPPPPLNAPGPGVSDPPAAAPATGSSANMSTATATNPAPSAGLQPPAPSHGLTMGIQTTFPGGHAAQQAMKDAASAASAMTPTTTYYGMNAQLVKSTGTLTPLGEDKISTAGPSGTQKAKQTKKKAAVTDGETAKKPSPRVRAKADPSKAEKRKASPARNNNNLNSSLTNGAVGPPLTSATPSPVLPTPSATVVSNPANSHMGANTPTGQQHEVLLPSQDTELRKHYLQRIYRQLQMTHRNQDDAMVRRLATNIEIDICRRAATREDYVTYMNQQINSLMQAELTNGTVGLQSSLYVPGVGMPASSNGMNASASTSNGMVQPGLQQASPAVYKQNPAAGSSATDVGQRTSASSQGSFMSLLSSQAPMQNYEGARGPQQYGAQGLPFHGRQAQYGAANTAPGYASQGHGVPQALGMKTDPQTDLASQQAYAGQRMPAQPSSTSAPAEFAAQFQRLDRNGLLDLLWTQHKTVIQYQRRLAQLEVQLNSRPPVVGAPANNMTVSPANNSSGYYNAPPQQPTSAAVPANVAAEAEAQRARDRANSRTVQHPGHYGQPHYPPPQAPATPPGGVNPPLYWEKVRYLSEAYLRHLYVAHHALSQHSAPANSAQGAKAENVKHNIGLACQILSETPTNAQPRPLEVLDSIERFIQSTVVPIVRKVSPQAATPTAPGAPSMPTAAHVRPQQHVGDINDQSRNIMMTPTSAAPQTLPTPPSAMGVKFSNGQSPPGAAPPGVPSPTVKGPTKVGKGGAKAGGKKSPVNGPKKTTTPKSTAPKTNAKAGGKKSPGKASGGKQATTPKSLLPNSVETTEATAPLLVRQPEAAPVSTEPMSENALKDRSGVPPMKTGTSMADDDSLNDFADFADLDFDDDLQDPLVKVSNNKENAAGVNSRKRSIADV